MARTGGTEVSWRESTKVIYRPSFASMTAKDGVEEGEERGWRNRGNRVDIVRGERNEVELRSLLPAKQIRRMLEEKGLGGEDEEYEQGVLGGVTVVEYCFTNAVGKFSREALKEGSYKGCIVRNVKEQLATRARLEEKVSGKPTAVLIGESQIGRIAGEIEIVRGDVVEVQKVIRKAGEWMSEKVGKVKKELMLEDGVPDKIVIGLLEALRTPLQGMGHRTSVVLGQKGGWCTRRGEKEGSGQGKNTRTT